MGPAGPVGPPGPKGDPGDAATIPPPPPNSYVGDFYLSIDGSTPITLVGFAGCFDKIAGVEYEDCYFSTSVLSREVLSWFSDTVEGARAPHDLRLYQVDRATNTVTSDWAIEAAYLRDLTVSDFDAADKSPGTISFVVIPTRLISRPGGAHMNWVTTPPDFYRALFTLDITGVNGSAFFNVRGLHVAWGKVPAGISGSRRLFEPGERPVFDDVVFDVSSTSATASDLNTWMAQVESGKATPKDGTLRMLTINFTTEVGRVLLHGLLPGSFSGFPTGINRRTIRMHLDRFTLQ